MAQGQDPDSLTVLLHAWKNGQGEERDRAWAALYKRLHRLAHHVLRERRGGGAMATTEVLHEAAIKLMGLDIDYNDSQHFLAAAARCMRFLLVDAARKRVAQKRGLGNAAEELPEDLHDLGARDPEQVVAVHEALEKLLAIAPKQAELVELRYFGGMTVEEAAEALGIAKATAVRRWRGARVWLFHELQLSGQAELPPEK
ncbi:MAG: ECF-type sigma factor [Polyangiaceae bacterium]